MINLNLLSPEEKIVVNRIRIYYLIKSITFRVISLVLIITTVFVFTYLLLKNNKESLDNQIATEASLQEEGKVASIEAIIKELNDQLSLAKTVQDKYVKWTHVIQLLIENIPESITLNNMQFNTNTLSFRIAGTAADRDSLITFQEQLEGFPYLTNITSPISNLVQRENISFEITGQLTEAIYD